MGSRSSSVGTVGNMVPKEHDAMKAAVGALMYQKIQHEHEMKTSELRRKYQDIEKQREGNIAEIDRDDYLAMVHDQKVLQDNLKREIERERRDHEREKEEVNREFQRDIDMRKLEDRKRFDDAQLKARKEQKNLREKIENVDEKIYELNNKINEVDDEIEELKRRDETKKMEADQTMDKEKMAVSSSVIQFNNSFIIINDSRKGEETDKIVREYQRFLEKGKVENKKDLDDEPPKAKDERRKFENKIEEVDGEIYLLNNKIDEVDEEIEELKRRDEIKKMAANQTMDKEKMARSSSVIQFNNSYIIINDSRKGKETVENVRERIEEAKGIFEEIKVVPPKVHVGCGAVKTEK